MMENGIYEVDVHSIKHWVKIEGAEHETTPLVILHGGPGGNHYTFEHTTGPLLSKNRTVIYYEQRGCGRSAKPAIDTDYRMEQLVSDFHLIKKWLGHEKVDLLGYSFGGELALEIAYMMPEEIGRLVLSGPSLLELNIGKVLQIAGFLSVVDVPILKEINELIRQELPVADLYELVWNLADSKEVDLLLFQNQEKARLNRSLWEKSGLVNTGHMMGILQNETRDEPLVNRLGRIGQETLIIAGIHDYNTGIPLSKLIHHHLPNSCFHPFYHSAHFPDLDEPERFIQVVQQFLEQNSPC
ncbi:alpha/beta fold hydrolase [Pradoshia sp.]|uniref:alpha/beta fold hydrolase n=1 Tax=Pradoshia sp. TaxID=2651281 RepID=UPI003F1190E3